MDKVVVFAVAGSGKTTHLVSSLDENKRFLIVTYTEANYENLRAKIIGKFGHVPLNISLFTYFTFLHSFCYKPFLRSSKDTKGLFYKRPPDYPRYSSTQELRYMTSSRWLYSNRLAAYIEHCGILEDVKRRMEKYFDVFFVDEVQDFAGHDFNFLTHISAAKLEVTFVGDFYQHTYDTSRDGAVNRTLHDDYERYKSRFRSAGIRVDTESLKRSRRCSATVCSFISDNIGISIDAYENRASLVRFEADPDAVTAIYEDSAIVKLFYKEHYKYGCYSYNWGAAKGMDHYNDVCVVLGASAAKAFRQGTLSSVSSETRNKLYVACSRARGNLTFVPETMLKAHKKHF